MNLPIESGKGLIDRAIGCSLNAEKMKRILSVCIGLLNHKAAVQHLGILGEPNITEGRVFGVYPDRICICPKWEFRYGQLHCGSEIRNIQLNWAARIMGEKDIVYRNESTINIWEREYRKLERGKIPLPEELRRKYAEVLERYGLVLPN